MTKSILNPSIVLAITFGISVAAQHVAAPAESFRSSSDADKRGVLVQIIRHELPAPAATIADVIRAGLEDPDPIVRETALAAIVSRAAGVKFAPNTAAAADWSRDRAAIQKLRSETAAALRDQDERVRLEAIAALASLDFDAAAPDLNVVSAATEALLIERFYAEPSASVRAKIVSGFGTDSGAESASAHQLLRDAFKDKDHRVKHAASIGALKLGEDGIQLLVEQLNDQNRAVRLQAASVLAKAGPAASHHVAEIQTAIGRERDVEVQQRLRSALSTIRRKQ
jgi:HEAT repeat protein